MSGLPRAVVEARGEAVPFRRRPDVRLASSSRLLSKLKPQAIRALIRLWPFGYDNRWKGRFLLYPNVPWLDHRCRCPEPPPPVTETRSEPKSKPRWWRGLRQLLSLGDRGWQSGGGGNSTPRPKPAASTRQKHVVRGHVLVETRGLFLCRFRFVSRLATPLSDPQIRLANDRWFCRFADMSPRGGAVLPQRQEGYPFLLQSQIFPTASLERGMLRRC
jgi:hypothetical protein